MMVIHEQNTVINFLSHEPSSKRYLLAHENRLFYFAFYIVKTILQPIAKFNYMIIQFFIRPHNMVQLLMAKDLPLYLLKPIYKCN